MKCFDNTAMHFMEQGPRQGDRIKVCHGIVEARKPGEEGTTGHAWVEYDSPVSGARMAVDPSIPFVAESEGYRKALFAKNVVEYSPQEFLYNWWLNGYPGPWDTEIKKWVKP